jgi:hypothetical protein
VPIEGLDGVAPQVLVLKQKDLEASQGLVARYLARG